MLQIITGLLLLFGLTYLSYLVLRKTGGCKGCKGCREDCPKRKK